MHTHDKTYLASLGFADKDKADPRHDLACRYLTQAQVFNKIAEPCFDISKRLDFFRAKNFVIEKGRFDSKVEVPLMKGQGQYKTMVGFVDFTAQATAEVVTPAAMDHITLNFSLSGEVKIKPTPIGDVLRQIALYQQFIDVSSGDDVYDGDYKKMCRIHNHHQFVLATAYPITEDEIDLLTAQKIKHVFLGKGFEEYVKQQQAAPPAAMLEL